MSLCVERRLDGKDDGKEDGNDVGCGEGGWWMSDATKWFGDKGKEEDHRVVDCFGEGIF